MAKTVKPKWLKNFSTQERIEQAKTKTQKIVEHLLHVIAIHESNKAFLFSETLSSQIPPSRAAHTFNLLRDSQYRYELVRLCALWDTSGADRESIPTVAALIDDVGVRAALAQASKDHWVNLPVRIIPSEPQYDQDTTQLIETATQASNQEFGAKQHRNALRWLRSAEKMAGRVRRCHRFLALVDARDHHIAHNLSHPAIRKAPSTAKYGDENWLLKLSIRIVDRMYLGICGTSFDWDDSQKIAEKRAHAFWDGVSIKVLH
jgi:hypothetical protein